ncbi:alpha/beta fold hydrolase [Boseongicola sp. H5]|uniref:alpha/beta fold hydrolase n=1 Tax=Boseongicola sp. H5 TaxID=2763261 RepID=UPI001D0A89AD|nr:alpha/beta fold hydrolase [Boseongicola sp. H5]
MTTHFRQRPAVLLLHGLGGTGKTLWPIADALRTRGFRSVAPTFAEAQRRHPLSRVALAQVGLGHILAEARSCADGLATAFDGVWPIICGHSNGALLALALADEGCASRLVLMAPVPPPSIGSGVPLWVQKAFFTLSFGLGWQTGAIRIDSGRRLDPDPPSPEAAHTLLPDSGRVLAEALGLRPGGWLDPVRPLECDCTIITGENDRIVPAGTAAAIAARFAADLHVIRGAGHWFPAEARHANRLADLILAPAADRPSVEPADAGRVR